MCRARQVKRSVNLDQQSKTGIEFKASLITPSGGPREGNPFGIDAKRDQQKTRKVDRPSKNLSEYKASLIAAKAGRKREAQR
jgi:hypothetical protein